ncbi:DNA repair and recombination protein RadB [Candidatus Pacearchaeota archaeon CG10_big_fil_rev_8_21_14_0_10_32_14]|nr:MAG: DNA repair and recombination protein RadB [Candidatus Pacearchaeota archaeon CG10_big_fil_rev_8_21_14_0_10_32_14]
MTIKRQEKISSGSYDLNKWLFGGYESDIISMIAGGPGTGKTNLVMLAAVSQAKKGNKVIFVDTEGGFSIDRIRQLLEENKEDDSILENILLLKPTSFEEQKKDFEKLSKEINKDHVGLIVVDSMVMLYRLELGDALQLKDDEKIKNVNREMAKQIKFLAEISRKQEIPVIITNQVYKEFQSDEDRRKGIKPEMSLVGGDLLKYWSKCIIQLENEGGRRKAVLIKHRSLPQKTMNFEIVNSGVRKKGFI